jgi:hypothetical protein
MSLTLQQALADFVLQRLDLPTQRGLREEKFLRGAADVARLGHGHEVTQLSEFHEREHNRKAGSGQELGIIQWLRKPPLCAYEID